MRSLARTTSTAAPGTHVVVYDGECGFCEACARWLARRARAPLELVAFADLEGRGLLAALSPAEVRASAHYVTPDGIEYHGGEAVTHALRLATPGALGGAAALLDLPGVALVRDAGYALASRSRGAIGRVLRLGACGCGRPAR